MTKRSPQIPLAVNLPDDETFASFSVGDNALLIEKLRQFGDSELPTQAMLIVGKKGSGKSHLLHAACSAVSRTESAYCIGLAEHSDLHPSILENLEFSDLICLDDIDKIAGISEWETAIFDLYNRALEQGCRMLMTANTLPTDMSLSLPDLRSRLQWGLVEQVKELNDDDKSIAIQSRAATRGMKLSAEASQFLLNHYSRDMTVLVTLLDKLDRASMREKRKLTIPFIKDTLN